MKFPAEDLSELTMSRAGEGFDGYKVVTVPEVVEVSRWSILHRMIMSHDNKFYEVMFSRGATEYQEVEEFPSDPVECKEVVPVVVQVTQYIPKVGT